MSEETLLKPKKIPAYLSVMCTTEIDICHTLAHIFNHSIQFCGLENTECNLTKWMNELKDFCEGPYSYRYLMFTFQTSGFSGWYEFVHCVLLKWTVWKNTLPMSQEPKHLKLKPHETRACGYHDSLQHSHVIHASNVFCMWYMSLLPNECGNYAK